jgi:uncharacterized protein
MRGSSNVLNRLGRRGSKFELGYLAIPSGFLSQPSVTLMRSINCSASLTSTANLVPDAHLAAPAIEHGLTLCSTDGDFARFPALRWLNPFTSG